MRVLDIGGNDGKRSREAYPRADITMLDKKSGFDVEKEELPQGEWNIILANHIIEHLKDPDEFIDKCCKIMNYYTVLEISTPNMCAWFNRILFLLGYLPHSYEVSSRYNVGKAFDWGKERLGGHLRLFTPQALIQLLRFHGLRTISLEGECSVYDCHPLILQIDKLLTLNPNLASAFRVRAMKL